MRTLLHRHLRALRWSSGLLLALWLSLAPGAANAGPIAGGGGAFGLGIILGSPSGISAKVFLHRDSALDFAAGWGWAGTSAFAAHMDYLYHFTLARPAPFDLRLFVGVGGTIFVWGDRYYKHWNDREGRIGIGLRVPIGLAFHVRRFPIDPFFEIVPGLGFYPGVGAVVQGGIGIRYYF